MSKPIVLVDPQPRTLDLIFDPETRARLDALATLVVHEDGRMPDELIDRHLPETSVIIGQTDLPRDRLQRR